MTKAALLLERPDQFQALGDPTRMRVLGVLAQEHASVQALARRLGVPKGTVAHHVKVLEEAGLIRVVETQRVRGVDERLYARVARRFQIGERAASGARQAAEAGDDQPVVMLPLRHALAEAGEPVGRGDASASVIVRARMPAARARRFARLVEQLATEFADGAPGTGETFGFVAAVYVPDWSRPPDGKE